jgi:protein gp37
MSATSSIEWTQNADGTPGKTWNPVRGCSVISPGCVNCYAMKQAHRFSGAGKPFDG